MGSFPQELLVVVVGFVLLVQALYGQWRRRVALARATVEPTSVSPPAPKLLPDDGLEGEPAYAPRAIEELQATAQEPAAPAMPRAWHRPRRFSRTALLPDRRAVRNAVVVAAILRPCHAHRPHDID